MAHIASFGTHDFSACLKFPVFYGKFILLKTAHISIIADQNNPVLTAKSSPLSNITRNFYEILCPARSIPPSTFQINLS